MRRNIALLCILLAASMAATQTKAEAPSRTDLILKTFAETCFARPDDPAGLAALIDSPEPPTYPRLPRRNIQSFLAGSEGAGWLLPPSLGEAILIQSNAGLCSIFVRAWDEPGFAEQMEAFLRYIGGDAFRIVPETPSVRGKLTQRSWGLHPAGGYKERLQREGHDAEAASFYVVLSRNNDPAAPLQFAVSLGIGGSR